jgi:hypothetical protein
MHFPYQSILLTGLIVSSSSFAEQTFRQHEAHVHGHVELNIAQDANLLMLELSAPGADVVGFEHAPETQAQHDALAKALAILNQPEQLLLISGDAQCQISDTHIEHSLGGEHEQHDDHHDDDHKADAHHDEDHHDEAHHDEDHHDEMHEHESEEGHGAFRIEYQFTCQQIDQLKQIDTTWFSHFANTEEIDVNIITDAGQASLELDKANHIIKL